MNLRFRVRFAPRIPVHVKDAADDGQGQSCGDEELEEGGARLAGGRDRRTEGFAVPSGRVRKGGRVGLSVSKRDGAPHSKGNPCKFRPVCGVYDVLFVTLFRCVAGAPWRVKMNPDLGFLRFSLAHSSSVGHPP